MVPPTHPECGENTNGVAPAVLDECTRNHFKGLCHSTVGPLLHTWYTLCLLVEDLEGGEVTMRVAGGRREGVTMGVTGGRVGGCDDGSGWSEGGEV